MRRWVLAAVLAGIAHGVQAADLPDFPVLRGAYTDGLSLPPVNWQGAYIGGQFGYSSANMDFSKATTSLTNFVLQNLSFQGTVAQFTVLGKSSPTSTSFGGFVGYNAQWDDVILGVEANYNRMSNLTGSSTNTLPFIAVPSQCLVPPPGDTDQCSVRVAATASAKITDLLTLRGRAGWVIDNFLPYMFGGLAIGRADISRSVTVTERDNFFDGGGVFLGTALTNFSKAEAANVYTYGYTAGLGLEALLTGNVFARGEYEYVKFMTTKNIDINLNTVRLGLGYKF